MIIGSHVQMKAPDYLLGAVREALSYGANALMLYTGAPQNTKRVDTSVMKIEEAHRLMRENGLDASRLIVHAPYIINPANSVKPEVGELAVSFLSMDAQRTAQIGAKYLVLHPGSYTTTDITTGIQTAIAHLNEACIPDGVTVCLETMAGKGSEIGYRFEQIAEILDGLKQSDRYGVCLDTCHIHDAGYDLSDFDAVLDEFDRIIGLEKGSDDYITKPFSPKELVLRVNNLMRRVYRDEDKYLSVDGYDIDENQRTVVEGNTQIELTTKEFDLLMMFVNNRGKAFPREKILEQVWEENYFGSDRVVDDTLRRLRKKMPNLSIKTIYGFGYKLG